MVSYKPVKGNKLENKHRFNVLVVVAALSIAIAPAASSAAPKPKALLSYASLNAYNFTQADNAKILGPKAVPTTDVSGWNPSTKDLAAAKTPAAKRQLELTAITQTFGTCSPSLFTNPFREVDGLNYTFTDNKTYVVVLTSNAVQVLSPRSLAASSIIPSSCFYKNIANAMAVNSSTTGSNLISHETLANQKLPRSAYASLLKLSLPISGKRYPATLVFISAGKTSMLINYAMFFVEISNPPGSITYENYLPLLESVVSKKVATLS